MASFLTLAGSYAMVAPIGQSSPVAGGIIGLLWAFVTLAVLLAWTLRLLRTLLNRSRGQQGPSIRVGYEFLALIDVFANMVLSFALVFYSLWLLAPSELIFDVGDVNTYLILLKVQTATMYAFTSGGFAFGFEPAGALAYVWAFLTRFVGSIFLILIFGFAVQSLSSSSSSSSAPYVLR